MSRDRAEPALVHAFRTLAEAAEYVIVMLEPDGRIASWNSAAQRLFRRPPQEAIGAEVGSIVTGGAASVERDLALAAAGGQPDHEAVLTRADGATFIARVLLAAVQASKGEVIGYVLVVRALADERRRTFADKYFEVFENADVVLHGISDGVTVQDASGRLFYANDAAARISGFADAAAMLATPVAQIHRRFEMTHADGHPLDPEELPARQVFSGKPATPLLVRLRPHASGVTWWANLRASAITDESGRPELVVNIWQDVTSEQRKKEAARVLLEASMRLSASIDYEKTLAAVAQSLVPEVADWSSVDLVESGSRRSLAVAHADPEKVEYARLLRQKYPPAEDATSGVSNVIRTGKPELYPEIPQDMLRASAFDEEHWRVIEALGLRSAMCVPIPVDGRTEGALTLISAESGRRYDAHDLELACEIGRRAGVAIANARSYRAAQAAIRVRDEFLSIAGHELRTPLAALSLQVESLKAAASDGKLAADPQKYAARLDRVFGNVTRLTRLVDDLLDVARVSSGRLVLHKQETDLAALVRDVAARFTDVATRAGCTLHVSAGDAVVGTWDAERLEQVVSNLVSNALKYGAGKPVEISCSVEGADAVLAVRDDGIGISEHDQARIFGRFERAVSEHNYGGLGLGLWIVREIVDAHGGRVTIESAPERGATFRIVLPRTSTTPGGGRNDG